MDALKVQAKIEGHAENGTIIDEGGQRAQGERLVLHEEGDVQDGMVRTALLPQEQSEDVYKRQAQAVPGTC